MCSQSVSGSSLLSAYNEDDLHETSGRSRREFEQIDAVLYNEEVSKRSSIRKVYEEWSSKPHFRIRGRISHIHRQQDSNQSGTKSNSSASFEFLLNNYTVSSLNSNELNPLLDELVSVRSSTDSIDCSLMTNNSEIDDDDELDDASNTISGDNFDGSGAADSFDTDEDDDENGDYTSNIPKQNHTKYPQFFIKCVKDSVVRSLASTLFQQFLDLVQPSLQTYAKNVYTKNSIIIRPKLRPFSVPSRPPSQTRSSASVIPSNPSIQQHQTTMTPLPSRSTAESDRKLTSLLSVVSLSHSKTTPITTASLSPRKSQVLAPYLTSTNDRSSTSALIEKRHHHHHQQQQQQQRQISLIGTAIASHSLQFSLSTPQSSQSQMRQNLSTRRQYSATPNNFNIQHAESATYLPPVSIERGIGNDQLITNGSNTITAAMIGSSPLVTRAVSSRSNGSNILSAAKIRAHTNVTKLQRVSRSTVIPSNKDFNNSRSTSPARSTLTTTTISPAILKATAIKRTHQQQQQKNL